MAISNITSSNNTITNTTLNITSTTSKPYVENSTNLYGDTFVAIILTLYAIILILGFIGNILTCAVVVINRSMRRSIHLYTFNLAVADSIILLLYVPTQMKQVTDQLYWMMGKAMCYVAFCVIPLSMSASIATLIAISVDRYRGFRNPFTWRAESKRNAKILIPIIWIFSTVTVIPITYYVDLHTDNETSPVCLVVWPKPSYELAYWTTIMLIQYAIPLLFIAIVHVYMAWRIYHGNDLINRLHKRMMTMVILLLITYSVCTGMQHINFYLGVFHKIHETFVGPYLFVFSNLVVSLQAAINPFIYGSTRTDYKEAFKRMIKYIMMYCRRLFLKRSHHMSVTTTTNRTEMSTMPNSGNVTPIVYRKQQIKNNLGASNHLTVPHTYCNHGNSNHSDNDDGEMDDDKREFRTRLDTLEFLDVEVFRKRFKEKKKRGSWRRTFSFSKVRTNSDVYKKIDNIDTPPPSISISRWDSTEKQIDNCIECNQQKRTEGSTECTEYNKQIEHSTERTQDQRIEHSTERAQHQGIEHCTEGTHGQQIEDSIECDPDKQTENDKDYDQSDKMLTQFLSELSPENNNDKQIQDVYNKQYYDEPDEMLTQFLSEASPSRIQSMILKMKESPI